MGYPASVHAALYCWELVGKLTGLAMLMAFLYAGGNTILQDYPWGRYARYVDIAGAYGSFIAELLKANPKSTGVLFDQSQVKPAYILMTSRLQLSHLLHSNSVPSSLCLSKHLSEGMRRL